MDPNEKEDGLIEPPPVMLGADSPGATTSGVDVNEFTGGFQPLPIPPGSPDVPIDVPALLLLVLAFLKPFRM